MAQLPINSHVLAHHGPLRIARWAREPGAVPKSLAVAVPICNAHNMHYFPRKKLTCPLKSDSFMWKNTSFNHLFWGGMLVFRECMFIPNLKIYPKPSSISLKIHAFRVFFKCRDSLVSMSIFRCTYLEQHLYTWSHNIYLEPKWPLFLNVNPTKQGLFQPKQGSFEFQVYIYIWSISQTDQTVYIYRSISPPTPAVLVVRLGSFQIFAARLSLIHLRSGLLGNNKGSNQIIPVGSMEKRYIYLHRSHQNQANVYVHLPSKINHSCVAVCSIHASYGIFLFPIQQSWEGR